MNRDIPPGFSLPCNRAFSLLLDCTLERKWEDPHGVIPVIHWDISLGLPAPFGTFAQNIKRYVELQERTLI